MSKSKFSFAFFKTKTGRITLYVIGGLILGYIIYRFLGGGSTTVVAGSTGPSDAQIQAEAAQNIAQIQANAQANSNAAAVSAQNYQAGLAAQVANNQIQEQGNEAALGATVATATINAQLQGLQSSLSADVTKTNIASQTVLAQGAQQNQLLLGEMAVQQQEFNTQQQYALAGQALALTSTVTKKSSQSVKKVVGDLDTSISTLLTNGGGGTPTVTLH